MVGWFGCFDWFVGWLPSLFWLLGWMFAFVFSLVGSLVPLVVLVCWLLLCFGGLIRFVLVGCLVGSFAWLFGRLSWFGSFGWLVAFAGLVVLVCCLVGSFGW